MAGNTQAFLPDLLLSGGQVQAGAALVVRDGTVVSVGAGPVGAEPVRLPRRAILPGLVSAHSHAFQRALRGRTEYRNHPVDDFWSWREAMYVAAERLSPDDLEAVSRACFLEMARAGITCVGEFHYLHREPDGRSYTDPNELDRRVLRAARDAGLRAVLLRVAYARSGFGAPENPRQRRFIEPSADAFLSALDALAVETSGDPLASIGAAPHSVRACPAEWIRTIGDEAARRGWPLHLHVCEQVAEVQQCVAEHGVTPPLLLQKLGVLGARTTAVHGVHLTDEDISVLGKAAATVCACPTTERNLGDGIIPAGRLLDAGARLAVGTDSQCQIDPLEDARELEYHLRLEEQRRAILDRDGGTPDGLASELYAIASEGGMRALGLPGGALRPLEPADFIVVDLDDPCIAGAGKDDLCASVVFGLQRSAIREVRVAGRPIVRDAHVEGEEGVMAAFRDVMRRLWGGTR